MLVKHGKHIGRPACHVVAGFAAVWWWRAAPTVSPGRASQGTFTEYPQITAHLRQTAGKTVVGHKLEVAAANPIAVKAGADVSGRAARCRHALVAVQAMLGLVDRKKLGPWGGAFLVWYDAAQAS